MEAKRPQLDESPRVLSFRPRSSSGLRPSHAPSPPVEDIGKYERVTPEPDDYRHRMLVNVAAMALCALLIIAGVWIANKIADLRKDQDCVLAGRRNCAQLSVTGSPER